MQLIFNFIILSIVTYTYYRYAQKKNILDNPNERSSHVTPTVRGGGMVFFIAVLLYFLFHGRVEYPYFLTGFILLSLVGFIDDRKTLSAKVRFPFQLIAIALILFDAGLFSNEIPIYVQVISFIVAVGFVNAFNFMDGINGITGFYTVAVILPLIYINHSYHIFDETWFIDLLLAVLVFGFFNFRKKALMFAGDIGSMALASLLLFWLSKTIIELKSPVLLTLVVVYGIDSAWTILYRLKNKQNIFEAHRWHLYQKLVDVWHWPHLKVAGLYAGIQLLISFMIMPFIQKSVFLQLGIAFGIYLFFSVIYYIAQKYFNSRIL